MLLKRRTLLKIGAFAAVFGSSIELPKYTYLEKIAIHYRSHYDFIPKRGSGDEEIYADEWLWWRQKDYRTLFTPQKRERINDVLSTDGGLKEFREHFMYNQWAGDFEYLDETAAFIEPMSPFGGRGMSVVHVFPFAYQTHVCKQMKQSHSKERFSRMVAHEDEHARQYYHGLEIGSNHIGYDNYLDIKGWIHNMLSELECRSLDVISTRNHEDHGFVVCEFNNKFEEYAGRVESSRKDLTEFERQIIKDQARELKAALPDKVRMDYEIYKQL